MVQGADGIGKGYPSTPIRFGGTTNVNKSDNVARTPVDMKTSSTEFTRTDFGADVAAISNRAKMNSPEAQGLPSAQEVINGQLVSDYTFDDINSQGGSFNPQTFAMKYSSTNTPQVASATNHACEGFEYTEVAAHIQTGAFAEVFSA